jgi:hypothetical protein
VSAPAAHIEWLRLLLALAATKDWSIHHLDVKVGLLQRRAGGDGLRQASGFVIKGGETQGDVVAQDQVQ